MVNPDHLTRSLLQAQVNDLEAVFDRLIREEAEDGLTITAIFRFS